MNQKTYNLYAGVIFAVIAVVQLMRVMQGWPAVVNDVPIPVWVSWIAVLLAGFMAYRGFQLHSKR